jgi:Flp pilus assembly protein TadB
MSEQRSAPEPARTRGGRPRSLSALLWILLAAGVVVDLLSSAGVLPLAAGIAGGVVALVCIVALILTRSRRS